MTSSQSRPRRTIRALTAALMSCMAVAAVVVPSASAVSIHTTAEFPAAFEVSGGPFLAKSAEGDYISCEGETTGSGRMDGSAAGVATLEFHGCTPSFGSFNCTSAGAATGTIVTEPLAVELTSISGGEAGVMFSPISANSTFAAFHCGGVVPVVWSGKAIGEITKPGFNQYSSQMSVSLPNEAITEADSGQEAKLTMLVNGGKPSDTVLNGNAGLNFEYEFELSEEEAADGHPDLAIPGGFPATFSATASGVSESKLVLRNGTDTVTCTKPEGSGTGEFLDPSSGSLTLTLHNCSEELGFKCTSAGQANGTVKTNSLPIHLTYLSDGTPGIALMANEASGKVMEMVCGGFISVVVKGGVLGAVYAPELGEAAQGVSAFMNSVKKGEGYAQEYTHTEAGEEVGLQTEIAGGSAEPASLGMLTDASFGSEYVLLGR